jgi:hypothetical protein
MMMVLLALLATLAAQQAQAGQCVKESFEGAGYMGSEQEQCEIVR